MFTLEISTPNSEHRRLCQEYWDTKSNGVYIHSVVSLARARKISKEAVIDIVKASCVAVNVDVRCVKCDQPARFRSRNDHPGYFGGTGNWYCDSCRFGSDQAFRTQYASRKGSTPISDRDQVVALLPRPVDVRKIPLDIAVFLTSLIHAAKADKLECLRAVETLPTRLSPSIEFDTVILMRLVLANVLVPHLLSQVTKQNIVAQESIARSVFWQPPIDRESHDAHQLIRSIDDRISQGPWLKSWHGQVYGLWHRIALEECVEFMRAESYRRGAVFSRGKRTDRLISTALTRYSVSQVYRMIFVAMDQTWNDINRTERVSQPEMMTHMIDLFEALVRRCFDQQLEVTPMKRPSYCPETMIYRALHYQVLKTGYLGIDTVITREAVNKYARG